MRRLYYSIWADAITAARASRAEASSWKAFTLVPISLLMGLNLLTLFIWLKKLINHYLPLYLPVHIFSANLINDFIAILLTLFVPFLLLNYLLIFVNDRYQQILATYPGQNGKLYRKYVLITLGILAIPLVITSMFF
jgi:hypothetical protein